MKPSYRTIILTMCLLVAVLALAALAQASTGREPDYAVTFPQDAPAAGRAAPYGQYIITHLNVGITTTEQLGTVARTNGYHKDKAIICSTGDYPITVTLYARTTSTGDLYTMTQDFAVIPASTEYITPLSAIAPWMSLGLVSTEITPSTTTCGVYVQTP